MRERAQVLRPAGAAYEIRALGVRRRPLRDFYHALLRMSWPATISLITLGFLSVNALFAALYTELGGIAHAKPGSFEDAFFFSVQTMGTIGYGALYPQTRAANWIMVSQSLVSLILTALGTGLVFAKFSRPTARIEFSRRAVISPLNGVPTLMFRIGNARGNAIVNAEFRAVLSRTELTREGQVLYRMYDIKLTRDHALTLNRAFNVSHPIVDGSPFHGETPESVVAQEYELQVIVVGIDDTVMQQVHASRTYYAQDIVFGARLRDILSDAPDGAMLLDLRKFHAIEATPASAEFSYSAPADKLES